MNILTFCTFLLLILLQRWIYKTKNRQIQPSLEQRPTYPSSKITRVFGRAQGVLLFIGLVGTAWACFSPGAALISKEKFLFGLSVSLLGLGLLKWSLQTLGRNYAPCNLARMPETRVIKGPYKFFGHPIYLANLILLAGIVWTCPSVLGAISWLGLATFYFFSGRDENRALASL